MSSFVRFVMQQRMFPNNNEDNDERVKCPVCNVRHDLQEEFPSSSSSSQLHISHGAMKIFTSTRCPVCLEDSPPSPMVALACGHLICSSDFERLGGFLTQEAQEQARQRREEARRRREEQQDDDEDGRRPEDFFAVRLMDEFFMRMAMNTLRDGDSSDDDDDDGDDNNSSSSSMPPLERLPTSVPNELDLDDDGEDDRSQQDGNGPFVVQEVARDEAQRRARNQRAAARAARVNQQEREELVRSTTRAATARNPRAEESSSSSSSSSSSAHRSTAASAAAARNPPRQERSSGSAHRSIAARNPPRPTERSSSSAHRSTAASAAARNSPRQESSSGSAHRSTALAAAIAIVTGRNPPRAERSSSSADRLHMPPMLNQHQFRTQRQEIGMPTPRGGAWFLVPHMEHLDLFFLSPEVGLRLDDVFRPEALAVTQHNGVLVSADMEDIENSSDRWTVHDITLHRTRYPYRVPKEANIVPNGRGGLWCLDKPLRGKRALSFYDADNSSGRHTHQLPDSAYLIQGYGGPGGVWARPPSKSRLEGHNDQRTWSLVLDSMPWRESPRGH